MPQPYELHVHPPPNYLKCFFFLLSAFISIVFYNTLDLIQEFEHRHRDAQVRPPIDTFEVTSMPSVEAIPCASTPHGSGSMQFRPSGLGTFHKCLASALPIW
ncbi:hypothetical protein LXA43DRAFT_1101920 [Ganoderma leucocontextum]|nr:hypothetical protein LXA43DRAFT_1101920 [Ganoderma leucocontextum]